MNLEGQHPGFRPDFAQLIRLYDFRRGIHGFGAETKVGTREHSQSKPQFMRRDSLSPDVP